VQSSMGITTGAREGDIDSIVGAILGIGVVVVVEG